MQAARGTPLTSRGDSAGGSSGRVRCFAVFWGVALTAYAVDVLSKRLAVEHLSDRTDAVPLLGDLLTLRLTFNPGAAFSLGTEYTVALTCLAIVAVAVVLVVSHRVRSTGWALALGLLLAGISGNLSDRLLRAPGPFRGHVVDFFQLPHWPIFNVADICIDVAAALILLQTVRGVRLDGSRHGTAETGPDDAGAAGDGTGSRDGDERGEVAE